MWFVASGKRYEFEDVPPEAAFTKVRRAFLFSEGERDLRQPFGGATLTASGPTMREGKASLIKKNTTDMSARRMLHGC